MIKLIDFILNGVSSPLTLSHLIHFGWQKTKESSVYREINVLSLAGKPKIFKQYAAVGYSSLKITNAFALYFTID